MHFNKQIIDQLCKCINQRVGSYYLEVSFGTTGVGTWCYLECYLVLFGRCLASGYLGFYFGVVFSFCFFCGPKISAFLKLKPLVKNQFPPVVVTCLPGPLSGINNAPCVGSIKSSFRQALDKKWQDWISFRNRAHVDILTWHQLTGIYSRLQW